MGSKAHSAGNGKPALRAWLRLWTCVGTVERVIRTRLHLDYGMTLARFDYLSQLYRAPTLCLTMTELSRRLMVKMPFLLAQCADTRIDYHMRTRRCGLL